MNINIRPAGPADIDSIQTIAERAWQTAHAPIIGTEATETFLNEYYDTESFRTRIDDDATILHVAEDSEGTTVGFVMANPAEDPTTFHLSRIYVLPDTWGNGRGSQLLADVEEEIQARGGTRITLGVMAENKRALNFYEAAGYKREEEVYDETIDTLSYTYVKKIGE